MLGTVKNFYIKLITSFVRLKLLTKGVKTNRNIKFLGIPRLKIKKGSDFRIGSDFILSNSSKFNPIGYGSSLLYVRGILKIGNNVGISSSTIISFSSIEIGDNVKIGGNSKIFDTDFHSLDYRERSLIPENKINVINKPILLKRNVFIGTNVIILKGVTIGENSIVAAGSVVSKSIPENQIWGGNPAQFIKNIN